MFESIAKNKLGPLQRAYGEGCETLSAHDAWPSLSFDTLPAQFVLGDALKHFFFPVFPVFFDLFRDFSAFFGVLGDCACRNRKVQAKTILLPRTIP